MDDPNNVAVGTIPGGGGDSLGAPQGSASCYALRTEVDMLALGSNDDNDKRVRQQAQGVLDDCLAHDRRVVGPSPAC